MGLIVRTEPKGAKFMEGYSQFKSTLKKARSLQFIKKFKGHNKEVTKTFTRSISGVDVEIGDINFPVIESSIATATKLPQEGEKWFKNKDFDEKV